MPAPTRSALLAGADRAVPAAVLAALPTLGLFAGPAYAALLIGLGLLRLARALAGPGGRLGAPDRGLALFVAAFLLLCWASPLWSIVPATSLRGAAQASLILLPLLVLLCPWPAAEAAAPRLLAVIGIAIPIGAVLASLDLLTGLHVQALIVHRPPIDALTKYNRGLDYLSLIVWPVAGALWRRGARARALALLAVVALPVLLGHSLA
ncbi:MAG: hypothetical protein KGL12_12675, partial [Rhodospirillales bacterium]|nr:hypothetical protein [Rhodospirillales bacterium]